jgi:uncharacterized zinc-type alcohol dehydrogenase-like protein
MNTSQVKAYGAADKEADLIKMNIERRVLTASDIEIEILF